MVVSLLMGVLALARPAAQSDSALARIQAQIVRPAAMCGEFDQRKTLVGIKRPVRSSGRFCVVAQRGVLWRTVAPFPSTLRLTRAEIVESQAARVTARLSARDEPTVAVISELLFSVLAGDFRQLRATFTIDATTNAPGWQARLEPKDTGLRRIIATIELSGDEHVRQITIMEASGDRTVIAFSAYAVGASALTADDLRELGVKPAAGPPSP